MKDGDGMERQQCLGGRKPPHAVKAQLEGGMMSLRALSFSAGAAAGVVKQQINSSSCAITALGPLVPKFVRILTFLPETPVQEHAQWTPGVLGPPHT